MPLALPAVARVGQGHTTNSLHPIDNALSMGAQARKARGRRYTAGRGQGAYMALGIVVFLVGAVLYVAVVQVIVDKFNLF